MSARKKNLSGFEDIIGYKFVDISLLDQSLTHGSASTSCNERLEFLGDSMLGLIIAKEIYERYPDFSEGKMSRLRSSLVNGIRLAQIAKQFHMSDYIKLGFGEKKNGGAFANSILADALEALIAAIYLDGGYDKVHSCVARWYEPLWDQQDTTSQKDYKSQLQEWLQARHLSLPDYTIVAMHGLPHDATFEVSCVIESYDHQETASSKTRREAEQIVAKNFLEWLNEQ